MGLTGLDPLSVANAQLASAIVDSKSRLAMATRVACLATLASLSWVAIPPPKGKTLYIKLRDDPATIDTVALPVPQAQQ